MVVPTSKNPLSHSYVALDPTSSPVTLTVPYDGADSLGQKITVTILYKYISWYS